MAPHNLSPAAQKALGYWGIIELAAEVHATTADLWGWIRDAADELGLATPGVTVQGVSELRGRAGQIQEAARRFGALADNRRVRGDHLATPPWARTSQKQRALPKFAVRFQHEFMKNGERVLEWRTSVFTGRPNQTAGQLRSDVDLDARNMANKYGTEHLGVSNHQLLVI